MERGDGGERGGAGRANESPNELGRAGEEAAARYLEARGYEIVARNARAGGVELDLVARLRGLWVFVEVKSRSSRRFEAFEGVDGRKRARIARGAEAFLAAHGVSARELRLDVITCHREHPRASDTTRRRDSQRDVPGWLVEHWPGAFDAGE